MTTFEMQRIEDRLERIQDLENRLYTAEKISCGYVRTSEYFWGALLQSV